MASSSFPRFFFALLCVAVAGCEMPRDPEGSFRRVQGGVLRAGISDNQPWTGLEGEAASGIEVELLKQFAEQIGAEITWKRDAESELFKSLEGGSLDVVIAGLTDDTPWASKIGLTQPYLIIQGDARVIAVRAGENRLLLELDKFLQRRRGDAMRSYLQASEPD